MSLIALSARSSDWRLVRSLSGLRSLILFLVELQQRQVLALLQAGQVLDLLAGRLQDVDVLELLVGQLDLGLVLEDVADRGLEVLVGERAGAGCWAGPAEAKPTTEAIGLTAAKRSCQTPRGSPCCTPSVIIGTRSSAARSSLARREALLDLFLRCSAAAVRPRTCRRLAR